MGDSSTTSAQIELAQDSANKAMKTGLIGLAILPVITLLEGWAISCLWSWFIVPIFALSPLSFLQAIGFALIVRLILPAPSLSTTSSVSDMCYSALGRVIALLIMGYIVHWLLI